MTDIKTLRDALQELVDRDCRVFDRTLEITFESHQQAMRALRAAREAYQAVDAAWPTAEPDCWAILTPNGSRLVPPDEAKGRRDAYRDLWPYGVGWVGYGPRWFPRTYYVYINGRPFPLSY